MVVLLKTEGVDFNGAVVYVGHRQFINCTFSECTMVVRELTNVFDGCTFGFCHWKIDLLLTDFDDACSLGEMLETIRQSLPRKPNSDA